MAIFDRLLMPTTTAFCLIVCYLIKSIAKENETVKNLLPTIAAVLGIVVSCVVYQTLSPDIILSGMVSGVAASGSYDMVDNFIHKKDHFNEDNNDGD